MLALALVLATVASLEPVKKGTMTLTEMVDAASFICVGTVDEVITVASPASKPVEASIQFDVPANMEFARIRIERVIKGDPTTKVAYHEAWSTWMCDTTRVTLGERSLFILCPGQVARMSEANRLLVEGTLGSTVISRNVNSGDGIIPIRKVGETEVAYFYPGPKAYTAPKAEGEMGGYKWLEISHFIEGLAQFAPETTTVLAGRSAGDSSFELRLLPDGRRRLARGFGDDAEIVVDRMESKVWESARRRLFALVGESQRAWSSDAPGCERRLQIRSPDGQLEFVQPRDFARGDVPLNATAVVTSALEAWAIVRASIDCASCRDDREQDARLIVELRR